MFASTKRAPIPRSSSGESVFTVAWVPTGMNTGVSTGPWGVWSRPALARPSTASSLRLTIGPILRVP